MSPYRPAIISITMLLRIGSGRKWSGHLEGAELDASGIGHWSTWEGVRPTIWLRREAVGASKTSIAHKWSGTVLWRCFGDHSRRKRKINQFWPSWPFTVIKVWPATVVVMMTEQQPAAGSSRLQQTYYFRSRLDLLLLQLKHQIMQAMTNRFLGRNDMIIMLYCCSYFYANTAIAWISVYH